MDAIKAYHEARDAIGKARRLAIWYARYFSRVASFGGPRPATPAPIEPERAAAAAQFFSSMAAQLAPKRLTRQPIASIGAFSPGELTAYDIDGTLPLDWMIQLPPDFSANEEEFDDVITDGSALDGQDAYTVGAADINGLPSRVAPVTAASAAAASTASAEDDEDEEF